MLNNSVVGRKLEFLKRVGPTYGYGCFPPGPIDLWRSRDFPKLISPVIVNEHRATTKDHFNCHPDLDYCLGNNGINDHCHPGYDIIFTSGATEALRILATSFPWKGCTNTKIEQIDSSIDQGDSNGRSSSVFIYPHNSHRSLVGMRGPAMAAGATFRCIHLDKICAADCSQFLEWATTNTSASVQVHHNQNDASKEVLQNAFSDSGTNECKYTDEISHLLALPLECNFGGDVIPANSIFRTVRRCNTGGTLCLTLLPLQLIPLST
jgi:hypothetical protein